MFSMVFPGQGSQLIGMGKEFYENFDYVKLFFDEADEILKKKLSKTILDGPSEELDKTHNTQPAIFLISYSIFQTIKRETDFKIENASFFAGHSLGEYSALCCANSINFKQTINLLKCRGEAMQNAMPNGLGGMLAILGVNIDKINVIFNENKNRFKCYIANDNSIGQIVVSGKKEDLEILGQQLKKKNIKYIKLAVSAPFHSPLMSSATDEMKDIINNTKFIDPVTSIISNVSAEPVKNSNLIKMLLIDQIEKPVRWRESVNNMIKLGTKKFIEVGPGKVLSGLIKRINRDIKLTQVNTLEDIKNLLND